MLVERGVLVKQRGYTLAPALQSRLAEMRRTDNLRATRTQDVRERVDKILSVIPDHERTGLTTEQWLSLPQANGISFREAIDRDDSRITEMVQTLGFIESMLFRKGKIVEDALSLPIGNEIERRRLALKAEAEAKEAAHREAERLACDRRRERIFGAAHILGADGEEWISEAKPQFAGLSALERGQLGDAELDQVLMEINREFRRREIERKREQEIGAFRSDLTDDVTRILADAAGPFLRSRYEDLGHRRPIEYCVSKETYMTCVALAEKVRKQRAGRRR